MIQLQLKTHSVDIFIIYSVKNKIENISKSLFFSFLRIDNFLKRMDTPTNILLWVAFQLYFKLS